MQNLKLEDNGYKKYAPNPVLDKCVHTLYQKKMERSSGGHCITFYLTNIAGMELTEAHMQIGNRICTINIDLFNFADDATLEDIEALAEKILDHLSAHYYD
jgi:hypothetical protein